jgi:T5orf172 domain
MLTCAVEGCKNSVPSKHQNCWECGLPHCTEHLTLHARCQKFKLCPNARCMEDHLPYCETKLPHRGPLPVLKTIGEGRESVYVYYMKTEYELAKLQSRPTWLCKVGRTVGEPDLRILTQGALTAHSEVPIVPLVFKTEDSRNLERLIHAALAFSGRHRRGAPGTEWFDVNPSEIESLYESFHSMRQSLLIEPR